jgi:hypothetical protein
MKKIVLLSLLLVCFGLGAEAAKGLPLKEVVKQKKQLAKLDKDVNRLQKKLKATKNNQLKATINNKIKLEQAQIKQIKQRLYPKAVKRPAAVPKISLPSEPMVTMEVGSEEGGVSAEGESNTKVRGGWRYEIGGNAGFFAGTTAFLAELKVPLRYVFGPATTALRLSSGLTQTKETDRRLVPVNLDLIFNFPPGWFSGVENYLGAGLNYVVATSDGKQGTLGGELFYGVASAGFGGTVYGELGYAVLRTGFAGSYKAATVLAGYRQALF